MDWTGLAGRLPDRIQFFYAAGVIIFNYQFMKIVLAILSFLIILPVSAQYDYRKQACITDDEYRLYLLINEYRETKGLPAIPLSASLSYVAGAHAWDLDENQPDQGICNMHSWSDKGPWTACCYTDDHEQAECLWSKPGELTSYDAFGYEIAYYNSQGVSRHPDIASAALEGWKNSPGHNRIIINKYAWKRMNWKAMGVGIYKHYVVVWFGEKTDKAGRPKECR